MFELSDLLLAAGARVRQQGPTSFTRVVISGKGAERGSLFVALRGKTRDGHDFVTEAVRSGVSGVLVSREVDAPPGVTVVEVPDVLRVLQDLAMVLRHKYNPRIVAVTGSAGKTTTKDMIAHIMKSHYAVLKSAGSYNNHLGVPITLSALEGIHSHVVMEIGTNNKGEVDSLARLATPDVGIITNVGFAHIGNFGNQAEIAAEKVRLFAHVKPGGVCIFNGDDKRLRTVSQHYLDQCGKRGVSVGFDTSNDLFVELAKHDETGSSGVVRYRGNVEDFSIGIPGRHFVYLALLAVAAGLENGIGVRSSVEALKSFSPPSGRSTLTRLGPNLVVIDDSYNASPDAVLAALSLLSELPGKTKIAALGEMRELGQASEELHALVGARAASVSSHVVTVGRDGELMLRAALRSGLDPLNAWSVDSARDALHRIRQIVSGTTEESVVLVKGARLTHMERVALGLCGALVECGLGSCQLRINCSACPQLEVP
ncbi:MAG: UDP-N-acetylmuramoyl-tripeptide--D-alanyl-D-alanine ligase [Pseudonocardiaceae bacterium]